MATGVGRGLGVEFTSPDASVGVGIWASGSAVGVRVGAWYSSALVSIVAEPSPPAASTIPFGSKVAVCPPRALFRATGKRPGPARRVVQFGARGEACATQSPATRDHAVGQ